MYRLDIFPARVTLADGSKHVARVVVDSAGRAVALTRGDRRGSQVEVTATLVDATVERLPDRRAPAWTVTAGDQVWRVERAGGCGCGDPLRRYDPADDLAAVPA